MTLSDKIARVNIAALLVDEGGMFSKGPWTPEKFVQLFVDEEPYLRFGEKGIPTHSRILCEFVDICREAGDPVISEEDFKKYISKGEVALSDCTPPPLLPDKLGKYHAIGMGTAYVDKENHTIRFEGYSQDYGLKANREHLNQISPHFPD